MSSGDEERVERFDNVRRLRRNWIVPALCAAAVVAGVVMTRDPSLIPIGLFAIWMGAWLGVLTLYRSAFQLSRATTVEATASELRVGGRAPIAVENILEARAVQRGRDASELVVELKLSVFETIALRMPAGDADHLVHVLGVAPGQRRASFALIVPLTVRFVWMLLLVGLPWYATVLFTSGPDFWTALLLTPIGIAPICALLAGFIGFLRGRVTVGADGFTTSWYGWKKHHRFASVNEVRRVKKGMGGMIVDTVVRLASKKEVRLAVLDAPDTHQQRGAETRALADTMEGAFERWRRAPAVAEVGAHLGRGTRTGKEWLAGIDQLVNGGGNHYRIAAVTPEILAEVAKGTESPSDARVGAAAALLRLDARAHQATVRIAAEACAEPKVRVALLELVEAEGDDERITQALARVR